jgi:hypothetical protein
MEAFQTGEIGEFDWDVSCCNKQSADSSKQNCAGCCNNTSRWLSNRLADDDATRPTTEIVIVDVEAYQTQELAEFGRNHA